MTVRPLASSVDRTRVFGVALTAALITAQLAAHGLPLLGADDANIFMTYGRNLFAGLGFVYNPGFERVEGTTSFLLTLAHAAAAATPWPELVVGAFNLVGLAAILVGVLRLVERLRPGVGEPPGRLAAALFAFFVALHPGVTFWCGISLLDVALWTFLVVSGVRALVEVGEGGAPFPHRLALLSVALALTRPESLVLVPALLCIALLLLRTRGASWGEAARTVGPAAFAFAVAAGGLTLFRLLYFGFPFPNTYYAKVGADWSYNLREGLVYVAGYLQTAPLSALCLLATVATLGFFLAPPPGETRVSRADAGALSAAVLVLWALPVFTGGDHFAQGRFLVAATLLASAPALAYAARRWPRAFSIPLSMRGLVAIPALAGLVHYALVSGLERTSQDTGRELVAAERGRRLGRALSLAFRSEPRPTVGAFVVGGLGYAYEGRTLDLLGLNNRTMAHAARERYGPKGHAAFRKETFYALRPDLLPLGFVRHPADVIDPTFLRTVTQGLLDEDAFRHSWPEVVLARREPGRSWLEEPDYFVPSGLRGVWARSEGGPERYRFLRAYVHRELLGRVCAGELRVRVVGPGCPLAP